MSKAIIVAMERELVRLHTLQGQDELTVSLAGIGKVNAAMTAQEIILRDRPSCIINTGCAGGMSDCLRTGDIVIGAQTAYHDVWCGAPNALGQVDGLPQRFDADRDLLAAATKALPKAKVGLMVTGDQFFINLEEDRRMLGIYPDALCADMESAAIAQVCHKYGVPFLAIRTISDVHTPATASSAETYTKHYEGFWGDLADKSFDAVCAVIASLK